MSTKPHSVSVVLSANPTDADLRPLAEVYLDELKEKSPNTTLTIETMLTADGFRAYLIMQWQNDQNDLRRAREEAEATNKAAEAAKKAEKEAAMQIKLAADMAEAEEFLRQKLGITDEQKARMEIEMWAKRYIRGNLGATDQLRICNQAGDTFTCCLPEHINCCNKQDATTLFSAADDDMVDGGAVLGVCSKLAEVFMAMRKSGIESNRIRCTNNLSQVKAMVVGRRNFKYVYLYAEKAVEEQPKARMTELEKHLCGLPEFVSCCNKQTEVSAWSVTGNGELFGVCDKAQNAFQQVMHRHYNKDKGERTNPLLFIYTDFTKAEEAAAKVVAKTEERQQAFGRLMEYAERLAVWSLPTEEEPQLIKKDNQICCGIPQCPCGNKPVDNRGGYATFVNDGVLKGICALAGAALNTVNNVANVPHLRWAKDLSVAQKFASQDHPSGRNNNDSDHRNKAAAKARDAKEAREQAEAEKKMERERANKLFKELKATCKGKLVELVKANPDLGLDDTDIEKMSHKVAENYNGDFRTAAIKRMYSANGEPNGLRTAMVYAKVAGMTDEDLFVEVIKHRVTIEADIERARASAQQKPGYGEMRPQAPKQKQNDNNGKGKGKKGNKNQDRKNARYAQ